MCNENSSLFDEIGISQALLEHDIFKDELMKCDEFKNVKKINFIMPTYLVVESTGEPIYNNSDYIGQETKTVTTPSFRISEDTEFEFSETIDLYMIGQLYKVSDQDSLKNLDCGVWKMPISYDDIDFTPLFNKREIKIIFNPESLQDIIAMENKTIEQIYEERIEPKVKELFLNKNKIDSNTPAKSFLLIRCSERSIKIKEKLEK